MTLVELEIDKSLVIATRKYCTRCKIEKFQLVDREGISLEAFKNYKWAQRCDGCESHDFLEFWPVYKGERLEDTVNDILEENHKQVKGLSKELQEIQPTKQKAKRVYINKYSGNGRLSLHESVIIGTTPNFVSVPSNYIGNGDIQPNFVPAIDSDSGVQYLPNGTIDTITPLSYVFRSHEEFSNYLKLALTENYDTLYVKVESIFRKYVNVEEYYYPILVGDTIWSHFQDRFGYAHYLVFTGDNGSGKNSALLVFKYLGYRVFYVVSANAANYYTACGSQEEGQVSIAEDEADDIGELKEKRDILKAGYASGGTVPKIELEGGRSQDNWLVYGIKWLAMEELKEDAKTKGILHRSIIMKFIAGDVPYNIKDIVRSGGDQDYKDLYDELIHLRKLLFCFRLVHWNDPIPMIKLNVKWRTDELVKPLLRLFRAAPVAREKIRKSLSIFMNERNERMRDSFESNLLESVQSLIDSRAERSLDPTEEDKALGPYTFTNESIKNQLITDTEAREDPDKKGTYYSQSLGISFNQSRITRVLKSKFKAKLPISKRIGDKTYRCVEYDQVHLNRMKASYTVEKEIRILSDKPENGNVTPVTPVTPSGSIGVTSGNAVGPKTIENDRENAKNALKTSDNSNLSDNNQGPNETKQGPISQGSVTTGTTVTRTDEQKFLKCPYQGCPFTNIHQDTIDHHIRWTHEELRQDLGLSRVPSYFDFFKCL